MRLFSGSNIAHWAIAAAVLPFCVSSAVADVGKQGAKDDAEGDIGTPTSKVVIHLEAGQSAQALGQKLGLKLIERPAYAPHLAIYEAADVTAAAQVANGRAKAAGVANIEQLVARQQHKRDLPNDTLFSNQFHLRNTGQSGGTANADVNVVPWWNFAGNTRLGSGVNIAVVDDGVQHQHADLQLNYKAGLSYDFNFNDSDPTHTLAGDGHGTSVAGVAAGYGNNNLGVTGVAPRAGISGIRLISAGTTDSQEASALSYRNNNQAGTGTNDIYSNSWGPSDNGTVLSGPGSLTKAAFASGVATGRGGRGSIFTWAAGNGGNGDNSNFDGYANSRYVIAVGATSNTGVRSTYSERGANLFVNAPSSNGSVGITTTDRTGSDGYNRVAGTGTNDNDTLADLDYTSVFSGTSSSTPAVSGAVALMLEANPNLSWRDVKHILARTSTKNDPSSSTWTTNAAGLSHSEIYGFGRVNATAAATMAQSWTNVGPEISASASKTLSTPLSIPDAPDTTGGGGPTVSDTLIVTTEMILETVEVSVNISHTYRGDLGIILTAPSGTQSTLATFRTSDGADNLNWTFSTVRDWGELSAGLWTLSLRDHFAVDTGQLNSWSLNFFGTAVPEPTILLSLSGLGFMLLARRRRQA
ncbi:MAG TPA: S8 family serine peptidase [Tepidisphaeraceae bacterium]